MRIAVLAILTLLGADFCIAQQTRPTTRPTTRPRDASAPRDALKLLNLALRDGDSQTVKQLFQTRTPEEANLVSAMADYAAALAALHHQAAKTFGDEGANLVTGDTDAESAEGLEAIEQSDITITGDTALVTYKSSEDAPIKLTKIKGQWKLPLSQLTAGAELGAEQHRLEELASQAHLAQQTAEEIAQGKYKAVDDAAHAWRSRLLDVVLASSAQKKGE